MKPSFDENDWTDPDADVAAHVKSKVLAERAAWDFIADEGIGTELTVISPVGIFGPVLGRDATASVNLVERLLAGVMPGTPKLYFGVVDVRDVADLHLQAMTHPDGAGERFIASSGEPLSLHREESLKPIVRDLGHIRRSSSEKARQILGWLPRSAQTTLHDTADSLIELGLVGRWSPVAERTDPSLTLSRSRDCSDPPNID
jgi:nucleoside-diphosphate-sugar epimerase